MNENNILIRIPQKLYLEILLDLKRPHLFSYERVGFLFGSSKKLVNNSTIVICNKYKPVDDDDYIEDENVGAKINSSAIRKAMQNILDNSCGCFHVHLHTYKGVPVPSTTDRESLPKIVKGFVNIDSSQTHGIVILSEDSIYAEVFSDNKNKLVEPKLITIVGYPVRFFYRSKMKNVNSKFYARQSFLGERSHFLLQNIKIGIVGYGGGGSHIGQQLAHVGITNVKIFDADKIEDTNINRLIGARFKDIEKKVLKINIAKRTIRNILPKSNPQCFPFKWQDKPEELQECDIVVGGVDTYSERQQLEAVCRRYLIPFIDIGMEVFIPKNQVPYISGQVILSMPGMPCMFCMGFLTDQKLAREAARYGNAGDRPQVVWPNGLLASSAVGILVDLMTGLSLQKDRLVYLSYDGNLGILNNHIRLNFINSKNCEHYRIENAGKPKFKKI